MLLVQKNLLITKLHSQSLPRVVQDAALKAFWAHQIAGLITDLEKQTKLSLKNLGYGKIARDYCEVFGKRQYMCKTQQLTVQFKNLWNQKESL